MARQSGDILVSELINSAQRFQGWSITCAFLICGYLILQPSTYNLLKESDDFKVDFSREHRPHSYRISRPTELLRHWVVSLRVRLSNASYASSVLLRKISFITWERAGISFHDQLKSSTQKFAPNVFLWIRDSISGFHNP